MSYAMVLAADRPLPAFEQLVWKQMKTGRLTIEGLFGPIVRPGGFHLPTCCCETAKTVYHDLDLQADQQSLDALRAYLADTLSPGETVELWGIWEGEYRNAQGALSFVEDYARANQHPVRRTVTPEDLCLDDLALLEGGGDLTSTCITVQKKPSN